LVAEHGHRRGAAVRLPHLAGRAPGRPREDRRLLAAVGGRFGSTTAGTASRTVTGPVIQTQWGPVQVQVKVNGGKLADVSVLQSPNGNPRDQEINAYALPILVQESLDAQSANIDMVSGATVTSDGYLQSLQGALDKAGL
jgi:uncharacterized protein with FMN-binding domain